MDQTCRGVPVRVAAFTPPFCPNPDCCHHSREDGSGGFPHQARGCRQIARPPGWVRRFRCSACGRWFSSSCFSNDYWKKRPAQLRRLYPLLINGMTLRQAARTSRLAPTTIRRTLRHLARQALLLHQQQLHRFAGRLTEPVALDGLRTFVRSQYEVLDLHTAALVDTGFVVDLDAAPLRRSGALRPDQRSRRAAREARLGRPDPQARRRATARFLDRVAPLVPQGRSLQLRTDNEPDYARAIAAASAPVLHRTTSSRVRRDARNPLWRINILHLYLRHAAPALRRETIAFAKRLPGLFDRLVVMMVAQNNTKGVSERRTSTSRITPAMRLGLETRPLGAAALFGARRFPQRVRLHPSLVGFFEGVEAGWPSEHVRPHRYIYAA